jgi:hypothetical protein
MRKRYYIRIDIDSVDKFQHYLVDNLFDHECLSRTEIPNGTSLFSAKLDNEEALILKLKFPFVGFLDFTKTLGRQIKQV